MKTKSLYHLPINKKDFTNAVSDPKSHFGPFKYAIDFDLPEGTQILAPLAGKVVELKVDSNEGGFEPKYKKEKYLNYMTIQHTNGEFSQYLHLKYNGALVKVGDEVKQNQPIALSGNTGFTTEPHLHFIVFKKDNSKVGGESLEVQFKDKINIYVPKLK